MSRCRAFVIFCLLCTVPPAVGQSKQQPTWYNDQLSSDTAPRQFLIDKGECYERAGSAVPVRPSPPPPQVRNDFVASGALGGYLAAQQQAAAQQAQKERMDVFVGCMYRRGWELR